MLIRVASDLHLELFRHPVADLERHFLPHDSRDAKAVLVLAGDISSNIDQLADFLTRAAARFAQVFYVPGNHEYYGSDHDTWNAVARVRLHTIPGLITALGEPVTWWNEEGVRFILGTLWGDGGDTPEEQAAVGQYLNDFRVITFGGPKFTVSDMQHLHRVHREAIGLELSERPTVVVTHHMPSYRLSHPRFGNECTGGFAGKCEDLLEGDRAPLLWIHGHTHDTMDRQLGRTRIVCNPAGYYPEWQTQFNHYFAAPKFCEAA